MTPAGTMAAVACVAFAAVFHAAAMVHPDDSDEQDALALASFIMLTALPVVVWLA